MPTQRGELPDYPWDTMAPYVEQAKAHPGGMLDLSVGSPVDPTPEIVREAMTHVSWCQSCHAIRCYGWLIRARFDRCGPRK